MPKITTDRYYIKTFANLSRTMTGRKRRRKNNKNDKITLHTNAKLAKKKEKRKRKMLMSRKKIFCYEFFLTII